MEISKITIKEWMQNLKSSKYDYRPINLELQKEFGWDDYIYLEDILLDRNKRIGNLAIQVINSLKGKIELENTYLSFSGYGFKFNSILGCIIKIKNKDDKTLYIITPVTCEGKSEIWGLKNGFARPLFYGKWDEALKFLKKIDSISIHKALTEGKEKRLSKSKPTVKGQSTPPPHTISNKK